MRNVVDLMMVRIHAYDFLFLAQVGNMRRLQRAFLSAMKETRHKQTQSVFSGQRQNEVIQGPCDSFSFPTSNPG